MLCKTFNPSIHPKKDNKMKTRRPGYISALIVILSLFVTAATAEVTKAQWEAAREKKQKADLALAHATLAGRNTDKEMEAVRRADAEFTKIHNEYVVQEARKKQKK